MALHKDVKMNQWEFHKNFILRQITSRIQNMA